MLPIAYYLLKVIICSGILFGYYWLLLRNKVFHKYNRFYLMASVVLSLLLPLIKINFWEAHPQQPIGVIKVLQVVSYGDEYMDNVVISTQKDAFDTAQLYPFVYLLVSLILLAVFFHTLFIIARLLKRYPRQIIDKISFINTDAKSTPFSFLNYIFWNYNIDMETTTGNQIFKHELAHVQEGHTYDKLFINIILIFFWCNPFYWLYRKELNMIHEFIADKKAVEDSDTEAFAAMILQATYPQHRFQLTNNFFYSPIKRRLLMLTKNKNPKVNYFGRVMVLPLAILIFAAFTFKTKGRLDAASRYKGKKITVVIDAGHGGYDNGEKAADGTLEKDITLALAKEIKALNDNNNIEIILTKVDDRFLDVKQKTEFVEQQNASLYITLHTGETTASGLNVWIPNDGFPFSLQSRLLGTALVNEFAVNYGLPVSPLLMQRHLRTLENNPCPSIYVETGTLLNQKDLSYLQSAKGKENIAINILNSIERYAVANLQNNKNLPIATIDSPPSSYNGGSISINVKHADSAYLKCDDYKNKALVIVDDKQIGNVGAKYMERNWNKFSSVVVYNQREAKKIYGSDGTFGAIKLTERNEITIIADSIIVDDKNNTIQLAGEKTSIKGDLSNSLIYVDGKITTPAELNLITGDKINSVNILKGNKLDDIAEAKGKTSIINISLKPDNLQEVVVTGYKKSDPLYIIDGKESSKEALNTVSPDRIEDVRVIKQDIALQVYGEKGKDGAVIVNLKPGTEYPVVDKLTSHGNINNQGANPYFEVDGKEFIGYSLEKYLQEKGSKTAYEVQVYDAIEGPKKYGTKAKDGAVIITTKQKQEITIQGYSIDGNKNSDSSKLQPTDKVFTKVEVEASYPGGRDAWKAYLQKNLNANLPTDEGWKPGTYTLVIKFIVHADGSVSDVSSENYIGSKTALHCIDLIKKSSKWIPAVQNGRKVNAYRRQPITFLITDADAKKPITK